MEINYISKREQEKNKLKEIRELLNFSFDRENTISIIENNILKRKLTEFEEKAFLNIIWYYMYRAEISIKDDIISNIEKTNCNLRQIGY